MSKNEIISTDSILSKTIEQIIDGTTGIAVSEKKDYAVSLSRIIRNVRGGKFISTLKEEWEKYMKEGRISKDYEYSEEHQNCLFELLDYLENDIPNDKVFSVLKKIFFNAAMKNEINSENILPLQYIKIIKELTQSEILIMFSAYSLYENVTYNTGSNVNHYSQWAKKIAKESGLKFSELVEYSDESLVKKRLLTPRIHTDGSGITINPYNRLTELGLSICIYVKSFEE